MNVILTSPQAMAVYLLDSQALTSTYFRYLGKGFDTLRMSCLMVFLITVWISMCTASKTHTDCAFQVSQLMPFTCSCGSSDSHTPDILKFLPRTARQCLKIQIINFLYFSLLTPRFLEWLHAFGKLVNPSHNVHMYFMHPDEAVKTE